MRRILLALLLAGCSGEQETITMAPQLSCPEAVRCHAIVWRVGIKASTFVGGTHIVCRCIPAHDDDDGRPAG